MIQRGGKYSIINLTHREYRDRLLCVTIIHGCALFRSYSRHARLVRHGAALAQIVYTSISADTRRHPTIGLDHDGLVCFKRTRPDQAWVGMGDKGVFTGKTCPTKEHIRPVTSDKDWHKICTKAIQVQMLYNERTYRMQSKIAEWQDTRWRLAIRTTRTRMRNRTSGNRNDDGNDHDSGKCVEHHDAESLHLLCATNTRIKYAFRAHCKPGRSLNSRPDTRLEAA